MRKHYHVTLKVLFIHDDVTWVWAADEAAATQRAETQAIEAHPECDIPFDFAPEQDPERPTRWFVSYLYYAVQEESLWVEAYTAEDALDKAEKEAKDKFPDAEDLLDMVAEEAVTC
jgi:ADP-ribose pyrophosphatase YjhB (NUDIX family)